MILDNLRKPLNQAERATIQGDIPYYGANRPIDYINDFIFDEEIVLIGEDGDHFLKWDKWAQPYLVSHISQEISTELGIFDNMRREKYRRRE